ncbi:hypothetical protein HWV62_27013 [Athelia sp. TMB]|nr:hypothetical protein HWV62_27013 [Athelia sp. TMB]
MALSLNLIEIRTSPGVTLADGQIPRMSFLTRLPLERLSLTNFGLSALEVPPDVISLCVNQGLGKPACNRFFSKLAKLSHLCDLEMQGGWSEHRVLEASKAGVPTLCQLLYLRFIGLDDPSRTQEVPHRNPLRALLQQFQAPRLHLCEIVCRTVEEGHQALSLFSRRDNLLMSSNTLEELTLHFYFARGSTPNVPTLPYGELVNVLPPIHQMRLAVTPRRAQYSLHLVFADDFEKQRPLRRALRRLDLHYSDEESVMDFIRACVPSHRPRKGCVYAETKACWELLQPSFIPGLHSLKLNPKYSNK